MTKNVNAVDPQRVQLWQAFSNLFLDTEIEPYVFDYIARTICESAYSAEEAHQILWHEVYPVLASNLNSIAGVWDGWSDAWLLEHLQPCTQVRPIRGSATIIGEIERCWREIAERVSKPNT